MIPDPCKLSAPCLYASTILSEITDDQTKDRYGMQWPLQKTPR